MIEKIDEIIKILTVNEFSVPAELLGKIKDLECEYKDMLEDSTEDLYNLPELMYQLKNLTGDEIEVLNELLIMMEETEATYVRFINP